VARSAAPAVTGRRYPPSVYAAAREGFRWTLDGILRLRLSDPDAFAVGAIMTTARCGLQRSPWDDTLTERDRLAWIAGAAAAPAALRLKRSRKGA
jgi:hypothetical protein